MGNLPNTAAVRQQLAINISRRWNSGRRRHQIARPNDAVNPSMSFSGITRNAAALSAAWPLRMLNLAISNVVETPTMGIKAPKTSPLHPSRRCSLTLRLWTNPVCTTNSSTQPKNIAA
jgi:hypothetical protein